MPSFVRYGKTYLAALFFFITGIQALISDNRVTEQEGVQIAIAFFTAVSVYLVPIITYKWAKSAIAAVLAMLAVLTTAIVGGIDTGDITGMTLAVLTALGVSQAPARSNTPDGTVTGQLDPPAAPLV